MAAGSKLALAQEPIVAVAFSAMLLAFSREKLHQTVLAEQSSLSVMSALLQVALNSCVQFPQCDARGPYWQHRSVMQTVPFEARHELWLHLLTGVLWLAGACECRFQGVQAEECMRHFGAAAQGFSSDRPPSAVRTLLPLIPGAHRTCRSVPAPQAFPF